MRFSVLAAAAMASSVAAVDHVVVVGNGSLTFEPSNVKAAVGDTVTFKFWPKNHSVAQSTFAKPCEPMAKGFWSGYIPSTSKAATETFQYKVTNASAPIWFYCTQGNHCQSGMVGAINAPETGNTIEKFVLASKNATAATAPKEAAGTGGMLMGAGGMSGMGGMEGGKNGSGSAANSTTPSTGSAPALNNNLAFAGALGMFAYLLI